MYSGHKLSDVDSIYVGMGFVVIDTPQSSMLCFVQWVVHHHRKSETRILYMHVAKLIASNRKPMLLVVNMMRIWDPFMIQYRIISILLL